MGTTNPQTLYITFDRQQVAVRSDITEVLAGLEFTFNQMLAEKANNNVVAHLEVWRNGENYQFSDNGQVKVKAGTLNEVLDLARYQTALHLIEARPDLLWLHAGAVATSDKAILISGVSGQGKSTLTTQLYTQNWTYFSDDIIPLQPDRFEVYPFPQTPMRREYPGRELSLEQLRALPKLGIALDPQRVGQQTMPVGAVIFPKYTPHVPAELQPCSPATAAVGLIENSLNYVHHKEAAVGYICELVQCVPAFQFLFNEGEYAAQLVTQAEKTGNLFQNRS